MGLCWKGAEAEVRNPPPTLPACLQRPWTDSFQPPEGPTRLRTCCEPLCPGGGQLPGKRLWGWSRTPAGQALDSLRDTDPCRPQGWGPSQSLRTGRPAGGPLLATPHRCGPPTPPLASRLPSGTFSALPAPACGRGTGEEPSWNQGEPPVLCEAPRTWGTSQGRSQAREGRSVARRPHLVTPAGCHPQSWDLASPCCNCSVGRVPPKTSTSQLRAFTAPTEEFLPLGVGQRWDIRQLPGSTQRLKKQGPGFHISQTGSCLGSGWAVGTPSPREGRPGAPSG